MKIMQRTRQHTRILPRSATCEGVMNMQFSKRLDLFGPEIFAALNDKKVALEQQGKALYNLSVGTPDFPPAPHIKQALIDAA